MATIKILALCGSLRTGSYNKKLLLLAMDQLKSEDCEISYLDLKALNLPIFNEDQEIETGLPEGAQKLISAINESQGVLIASPEYNGSISGALKNAIDWASRADVNPFKGKVFGMIGTSPGWWGASKSLMHLRHVLSHLQGVVIPAQLALPNAQENLAGGKLTQESHQKQLKVVCIELMRFAKLMGQA